ncbi:MAG: copper resistance protein CopC [Chloroflexi bacterium]|nr:copper resistance protein CopC [Chloroflexota bacterium]
MNIRHLPLRLFLATLAIIILATTLPGTVSAHAEVIRSYPPDNSVVKQAPKQVQLWYSEAVAVNFITIQILDIQGQTVPTTSHRDNTDPTLVVIDLPTLGSGLYSIKWKVLSAQDGHFAQGLIVFGVGEGINLTNGATRQTEQPVNWIGSLFRWILYIGLSGLIGSLLVILLVVQKGPNQIEETSLSELRYSARQRLWRWAGWMACLALIAGFAQLAQQVFDSISPFVVNTSTLTAIGQISATPWGYAWQARQLLLVGILVLITWNGQREQTGKSTLWRSVGILLCLLLVIVSLTLTGHAAVVSTPVIAVIVDSFHLFAISLWVGGVVALAVGLVPIVGNQAMDIYETEPGQRLLRQYFGAYSRFAAVSVGIVIGTGIFSSAQQVYSPDALIETFYGRTLVFKILLVGIVGLAGLTNSLILHPALASVPGRILRKPEGWTLLPLRNLPTIIRIEAILGLVVLALSGLLTSNPPAYGIEFQSAAVNQPDQGSKLIGDLLINLSIKPNHPGQNLFYITAVSSRRPAPAEVLRVIVRMRYQEQDLGQQEAIVEPTGNDDYRFGSNNLSLPGRWAIDVVVRRKGVPDITATFDWNVLPVSRPVLISAQPFKPVLAPLGLTIIWLVVVVTRILWNSPHKKQK